ncbi:MULTISPECIES: flavin monoamine oxidase family protein [Streptomyces]|uniref:flavin monoamine oxidase family protein n=1 Tax=Streptomyces TaxID=1883 RepID=UPI0005B7DE72|nr:NAD(P)/FAD-dependent oxidoreductase [Streptomyces sp. NRRL F-5193]
MARTAPARMLRRIAAEHLPSTAPASPAAGALSRRGLLQGLAAGAGLAAVTAVGAASPARAATPPVVAVVGAGIAGLTTALRLADHGIACTVYEADAARVGGRIFSQPAGAYWSDGQVSEWGGELIDSGHVTMHQLAQRFGLPLDDLRAAEPVGTTEVYRFGGGYYSFADASADFKGVRPAIQRDLASFDWAELGWAGQPGPAAVALSNLTIRDWIATRVPGGLASRFGKLLDVAYTTEFGVDTTEASALGILGVLGYQPTPSGFALFGESDTRYHVRGGNQRLPQAIAAALPAGTVRHGWQLRAVTAVSGGRQQLAFTADGCTRTVVADHTVLALPLGVMQRLDLSGSGFDALKRASLGAMTMGRNAKLSLQFDGRPWNGAGPWGLASGSTMSETGYQTSWETSRAQAGGKGILTVYAGGSRADAFTPSAPFRTAADPKVARYASTALSQLEGVFPGITGHWTGKATLAAWPLNPLAYGSYAAWPPGYAHRYAGYEGVRQGNTHFAGEYTSEVAQGYMEGGAESGVRAADEVLVDLGVTPAG